MRANYVHGSSLRGEERSEMRKGLWRNGIRKWFDLSNLKFRADVLVCLCSFSYSFRTKR